MGETSTWALRVIVGQHYGAVYEVSSHGGQLIGSKTQADIQLDDDGVEAEHALLHLEGSDLVVEDISGKKGVKINGARQKRATLENGDQLAIGAATLRINKRVRVTVDSPDAAGGAEEPLEIVEGKLEPSDTADNGEQRDAPRKGKSKTKRKSKGKNKRKTSSADEAKTEVVEPEEVSPSEYPVELPPEAVVESADRPLVPAVLMDAPEDQERDDDDDDDAGQAVYGEDLWWPEDELPPIELQHVWFDLARDDTWRSLAIVPTDQSTPSLPVAHAFARMAALNPDTHVLVVNASPRGEDERTDRAFAGTVASAVKQFPQVNYDILDATALGMNDAEVAHLYVPQLLDYIDAGSGRYNKVLIALGSLIEHARSIPIARAVDTVLLNVGVGQSLLPEVSRTVEIVGKERVVGSLVVKPKG
jgi:hypothetical protein